jgi:hypothetical protein
VTSCTAKHNKSLVFSYSNFRLFILIHYIAVPGAQKTASCHPQKEAGPFLFFISPVSAQASINT